MKKNLLAILLAVVMIASCVLIIAPAAKAETAEVAIPEGSVMINDFSTSFDPVQSNWGGGESYKAWEEEVNGRSGVLALGGNASFSGFYIHIGDVGYFDQFETITIRLYVRAGTRAVYLSHNGWPVDQNVQFAVEEEKWVDYTIKVADYAPMGNGLEFRVATPEWGNQPLVFIDQIYGTPKAPAAELEIPEGAVMLNDFSQSTELVQNGNWGGGEYYQSWSAELEGRGGVIALGGNASYNGYYLHIGNPGCFDQYETIVLRMYVRSGLRAMWLGHNAISDYPMFDVELKDQWIEYSINVADFAPLGNAIELRLAPPEWGNQAFVYIDQIYAIPKAVEPVDELPIPEGAVLITDFSSEVTASPDTNWGHCGANAISNYYAQLDGRAGVVTLGADYHERRFNRWDIFAGNVGCFSNFESITIRMKVAGTIACGYYGTNSGVAVDDYGWPVGEWFELTLTAEQLGDMSAFNGLKLGGATESTGDVILIDSIYGTPKPHVHEALADDGDCTTAILCACGEVMVPGAESHDFGENNEVCGTCGAANPNYVAPTEPPVELPIPEGAILINDYSSSYEAVMSRWGGGESYQSWHEALEGRAGVLALGGNGSYSGFYIHIGDVGCFDQFESITIRMYVRAGTRAVYISHNAWVIDNNLQFEYTADQWVDYTFNTADIGPVGNGFELRIATPTWGNQPLVYVDQLFATPKPHTHEAQADDGDCTTAILCACGEVMVPGAEAHVAGEDDGDCTTGIPCANCQQIAVPGADAHDFGENNETCATCGKANPNYVAPTEPTEPSEPSDEPTEEPSEPTDEPTEEPSEPTDEPTEEPVETNFFTKIINAIIAFFKKLLAMLGL